MRWIWTQLIFLLSQFTDFKPVQKAKLFDLRDDEVVLYTSCSTQNLSDRYL